MCYLYRRTGGKHSSCSVIGRAPVWSSDRKVIYADPQEIQHSVDLPSRSWRLIAQPGVRMTRSFRGVHNHRAVMSCFFFYSPVNWENKITIKGRVLTWSKVEIENNGNVFVLEIFGDMAPKPNRPVKISTHGMRKITWREQPTGRS